MIIFLRRGQYSLASIPVSASTSISSIPDCLANLAAARSGRTVRARLTKSVQSGTAASPPVNFDEGGYI
jgi:hypothetical protein